MIALPLQSSLTMLVMQGWHRNLPQNLLHNKFEVLVLIFKPSCLLPFRGTQREYSSKPLKHSIVERLLVFKW